jgi:hypothetical protein
VLGALAKKPGVNPGGVMVCFVETLWENASFDGRHSSTRDLDPATPGGRRPVFRSLGQQAAIVRESRAS